jgi:hypothetical protein
MSSLPHAEHKTARPSRLPPRRFLKNLHVTQYS